MEKSHYSALHTKELANETVDKKVQPLTCWQMHIHAYK